MLFSSASHMANKASILPHHPYTDKKTTNSRQNNNYLKIQESSPK